VTNHPAGISNGEFRDHNMAFKACKYIDFAQMDPLSHISGSGQLLPIRRGIRSGSS
jgi:hypothetical protein